MKTTNLKKSRDCGRIVDMTQGNPMPLILSFALPLFIGNLLQQVYSIVDTMVVGYNYGDQAIAAIGATSSIYVLMIYFASGMNNGFAILVTQRFGAHDQSALKKAIAATLILNALVALTVTVVSLVFMKPFMHFLNTPADIFEQAYVYISIVCGGISTTICYNMFSGILRSVGNSRTPLVYLIVASILNVILDIILVVGFDMGIAGTALATVFAQGVAGVGSGVHLFRWYKNILPGWEDYRLQGKLLLEMLSSGFAMALMICVVSIGSVIMQRAVNLLDVDVIAANTASRRIIDMLMQPLASIATASSTFAGQNWGARQFERIQSTLRRVMGLEVQICMVFGVLIWLFGAPLVQFTTGTADAEVISNSVLSLRIHFTFYPFLGVLLCLRTSMQAMGYKTVPVMTSTLELVMKILGAVWLIPRFGFIGTSYTVSATWVICTTLLVAVYLGQRKIIFKEI